MIPLIIVGQKLLIIKIGELIKAFTLMAVKVILLQKSGTGGTVSGATTVNKDQIVDIIATRDEDSKIFTAYMIVDGEFKQEFFFDDSSELATSFIDSTNNNSIRFGFFHDDTKSSGAEKQQVVKYIPSSSGTVQSLLLKY